MKARSSALLLLVVVLSLLRVAVGQAEAYFTANAAAASASTDPQAAAVSASFFATVSSQLFPTTGTTVAVPGGQTAPYRANPTGDQFYWGLDTNGPTASTSLSDLRPYRPLGSGASILENGCIYSLDVEPSPSQAAFCVPAGLGSRFVSVFYLPTVSALGGVTDAGFIVLTGFLSQGHNTKCAYVAGPWTSQVTAALLEITPFGSSPLKTMRWRSGGGSSISEAERWVLCGLTRGGDLECMRPAGSWWAGTPPGGGSWPDFTASGLTATVPSESACVDITRSSSFWAIPLPLCYNTVQAVAAGQLSSAPPSCIAMRGPFTAFSISTCSCASSCPSVSYWWGSITTYELGSVLVATRAADGIPIAYHVGNDYFDSPPVTQQAGSLWTGTNTGPFAVDPTFPVFRACAHASMPYAGRLANGNYFIAAALADASGARLTFAAVTNMNYAAFVAAVPVGPKNTILAARPSDCGRICAFSTNNQEYITTAVDGPFLPAAHAYAPYVMQLSCTVRRNTYAAGVRHDGTFHPGIVDANIQTDRPVVYNVLAGSSRSDVVCFAFTSMAPGAAISGGTPPGSYRTLVRCIGSQTTDIVKSFRVPMASCDGSTNTNGLRHFRGDTVWLITTTSNTGSGNRPDFGTNTVTWLTVADRAATYRRSQGLVNDHPSPGLSGCACTTFGSSCSCGACSPSCTAGSNEASTAAAVSSRMGSSGFRCGITSGGMFCSFGTSSAPSWYARSTAAMSTDSAAIAVADQFACGILATLGLLCYGDTVSALSTSQPLMARNALTAQGFALASSLTNTWSSVMLTAGSTPVQFLRLTAGTDTVCGIFNASSFAGSRVACWGSTQAPAVTGHAILTSTFAGANGVSLSSNIFSAVGSARDVCVTANFACVLGSTGARRLVCWGNVNPDAAAAVAAANATTVALSRLVCSANSVCGVTSDSRLRCFGGLESYVAAGMLTDAAGLAPGLPHLYSPTELVVTVAAGGNDGACLAGTGTACASLKSALEGLPAMLANLPPTVRGVDIQVTGRTTSAAAMVSAFLSLARITISGMTANAAVVFTGSCKPNACVHFAGMVPLAVIVRSLTFSMAGPAYNAAGAAALSANSGCGSLFLTMSAVLSLRNVRFADVACSSAVIAHLPSPSTTVASRSQLATYLTRLAAVTGATAPAPIASVDVELDAVLFVRVAAPYGLLTRNVAGVVLDTVAVDNSTMASLLMLDKVSSLQARNIIASSLNGNALLYPAGAALFPSAAAAATFSGLANLTRCGGVLRLNSVSSASVDNVTAVNVVGAGVGGGVFCVTDEITFAAGPAGIGSGAADARPTLSTLTISRLTADGVATVDDQWLSSPAGAGVPALPSSPVLGGAVLMIAKLRRSAKITISDVTIRNGGTQGALHSGGGFGLWSVADVSLLRITCASVTAAAGAGGCIFASDTPNLQLTDVRVTSASAYDGGGCLALVRSTPGIAGVLDLQRCTALAGPGGAILFVDAQTIALRGYTFRGATALRGHGGAVAIVAGASLSSLSVVLLDMTFESCSAGARGGAVSILSALDNSAPVSISLARMSITDSMVATPPALPASRGAQYRSYVCDGYSANSVAARAISTIQGGGAVAVAFVTGDASATTASAVMPVGGSPGNTGIALPAVDVMSSVISNCSTAIGDGGAVLLSRATEARVLARAQVDGVIIDGCSASAGSGGAVFADSVALSLSDSIISNCTAAVDGGGVFTRGSALTSTSVVLAQNVAGGNGGGLASENCALTGVALIDPGVIEAAALPSVTPSVTPSFTPTSSRTPSHTPTASVTESPDPASPSISASPVTQSATFTPNETPTNTATASSSATVTASGTASATLTPVAAIAKPVSSLWGFSKTLQAAQQIATTLSGAFSITNPSVLALFGSMRGVHIVANAAVGTGGGVALSSCNAYFGGAQLSGNVARDGGGASVAGKSQFASCMSSFTGNMAIGLASVGLRTRGGTSSVSSSSANDALFARQAATTSAALRGDATGLTYGSGGGIAVLEPDSDADICSLKACDTIARLSRRGVDLAPGAGAGTPGSSASGASAAAAADSEDDATVAGASVLVRLRVPLSSLWPYFLTQSASAVTAFGSGEAYSRLAAGVLRGPPTSYAGPFSRTTSVARGNPSLHHGSLTGMTWPLAPQDYSNVLMSASQTALALFTTAALDDACPFSGNFAAGSGGDIAFATGRDASDISAVDAATLFASRIASIASHSDGAGGSIAVRTLPAVIDGSIFYLSSAGKGARERANTSAWWSATAPFDTSPSLWDGALQGYGGALAFRGTTAAAVINSTVASSFARLGGAVWAQPPLPLASAGTRYQPSAFGSFNSSVAAPLFASLVSGDTSVVPSSSSGSRVSTPQALLGTVGGVLLSGLVVTNATAVSAGGWIFSGGNSVPSCTGCSFLAPQPRLVADAPDTTAYGPASAMLPARTQIAITPYGNGLLSPISVPGRDFLGLQAVTVTSTSTVVQAPVNVTLFDGLNQTILSDYSTYCFATAYSVADGADLLSLTANLTAGRIPTGRTTLATVDPSQRYTAEGGVVSLAPFGLNAAPGQAALVALRCVVEFAGDAYTLYTGGIPFFIRKLDLRIQAVHVLANGSVCEPQGRSPFGACAEGFAAPPAQPLPLVSSTLQARYPPDWAIWTAFVEADGSVSVGVPELRCQLSAAVDKSVPGFASFSGRVLSGDATVTDTFTLSAATGVLRPLLSGNSGSRLLLQVGCTWVTGEVILSTQLTAFILRPRLVWQLDAVQGAGSMSASPQQGYSTLSRSAGKQPLLASIQTALGSSVALGTSVQLLSTAQSMSGASLRSLGLLVGPASIAALNMSDAIASSAVCGAACAGTRNMPAGVALGFRGGINDVDASLALQRAANGTSALPADAACALSARIMVKPRTFLLSGARATGPTGAAVDLAAVSPAASGLFGLVMRPGVVPSGAAAASCVGAAAVGLPASTPLVSPDAVLVLDGDPLAAYGTGSPNATSPALDPAFYAALLGRLPSAILSSVDGSVLQQLDPLPSLLVIADDTDADGSSFVGGNSSGIGVVLNRGSPQCSVGLRAAIPAAGGRGSTLTTTTAVTVGDPSPTVREEDGSLTFSKMGISQAPPGAFNLFLQVTCLLPSGQSVSSPPLPIIIRNVTAGFQSATMPLAVLPSGASKPVPLLPPPTMVLREGVQLPGSAAQLVSNVTVISGRMGTSAGTASSIGLHELPVATPTSRFSLALAANASFAADASEVPAACTSRYQLPNTLMQAVAALSSNGSTNVAVSQLDLSCLSGPLEVAVTGAGDATAALLSPSYVSQPIDRSVPCALGATAVSAGGYPSLDVPTTTQQDSLLVAGGYLQLPPNVGVVGSLGSIVRLTMRCTWQNRDSVASSPAFLLAPLAVRLLRAPPALAYPSSKARRVELLSPAPAVEFVLDTPRANALLAANSGGAGPLAGVNSSAFALALSALQADLEARIKTTAVTCKLDAWGTSPGSHLLIDPTADAPADTFSEARVSSEDGRTATFNIGVKGDLGTSFRLNASCTWLSSEIARLPGSMNVSLATMAGQWISPLPPVLLGSSEAVLLTAKLPLRLQLLQWTSAAGYAAFRAGGGAVSAASTGATNMTGFQLTCSIAPANASVILLPPSAAGELAVSSADGIWTSDSIGLKSDRGVLACIKVSCIWYNGQEIPAPLTCTWMAKVTPAWCARPLSSAVATASAASLTDDCTDLTLLPSQLVYNEPIASFGVLLRAETPYWYCAASQLLQAELVASNAAFVAAGNDTAASAGAMLSLEARQCVGLAAPPSNLPALVVLPWRIMSAGSRTGRCAVRAVRVGGAGEAVDLRGSTSQATSAASGVARFDEMAITPSSAQLQSMQRPTRNISVTVNGTTTVRPVYDPLLVRVLSDCFVNEIAADGAKPNVTVALPILAVAWLVPFPSSIVPALQSDPAPIVPPVTTAIVDINDADLTGAALTPLPLTASCSMRTIGVVYPPLVSVRSNPWFSFDPTAREPDTGRVFFTALVGSPSRPFAPGSPAVFSDVTIAATMGSIVAVEASCLRAVGGDVKTQTANVTMRSVTGAWLQTVPPAVLTDHMYRVHLELWSRVLLPLNGPSAPWVEQPGSRQPAPAGIDCSVMVKSDDGSLLLTSKAIAANTTDESGTVAFSLDFTTQNHAKGIRGSMQAVCLVNGQTIYTPAYVFRVQTVYVRACVPAPLVWLPSESNMRASVRPFPTVTLSTEPPAPAQLGASSAAFFGDGGYCPSTSILPSGDTEVAPLASQVPAEGTVCRPRIAATYFGLLNASFSGAVASNAYILDPAQDGYSLLVSQSPYEPIPISNLFLTARYGTLIALNITCRRVNSENAVPLTFWIRVVHHTLAWGQPMPTTARPGVPFNLSIVLRDDYSSLLGPQLQQVAAGTLGVQPAPPYVNWSVPIEQPWFQNPASSSGWELLPPLRATAASLTAPLLPAAAPAVASAAGVTATWANTNVSLAARAALHAYAGAALPADAADATAATALVGSALTLPRSVFAADPFRSDLVSVCRLLATRVRDGSGNELGSVRINSPVDINKQPVPPVLAPGEEDEAAAEGRTPSSIADVVTSSPAGIILQGAQAYARAGTAVLPAAAINARLGTIVDGIAVCSIGTLPAPYILPWTVAMDSCSKGDAPDAMGMTCANCGNGRYSDGGAGASNCTVCPPRGVTCTGGILNLLPGFYRADLQNTINEATELHPCWFPEGCVVDVETPSRRYNDTHYCAVGYTGPLCGLCDQNGGAYGTGYARQGTRCLTCMQPFGNVVVTLFLPMALIALGFFVANRRLTEVNPRAPLTRIIITHVQTLGSLLSDYVSKGTETFRNVFGISEIAGSSPLALQPIQCALRLGFYEKFVITLLLPFLLVSSTLLAAWVMGRSCTHRLIARLRKQPLPPSGSAASGASSSQSTAPGGRSSTASSRTERASVQQLHRKPRSSMMGVIALEDCDDEDLQNDAERPSKAGPPTLPALALPGAAHDAEQPTESGLAKDADAERGENMSDEGSAGDDDDHGGGRGGRTRVAFTPAGAGGTGGSISLDGEPGTSGSGSGSRAGGKAGGRTGAAKRDKARARPKAAAASALVRDSSSDRPALALDAGGSMVANPLQAATPRDGAAGGSNSTASGSGAAAGDAPSAMATNPMRALRPSAGAPGARSGMRPSVAVSSGGHERPQSIRRELEVRPAVGSGLEFWRGHNAAQIESLPSGSAGGAAAAAGGKLLRPASESRCGRVPIIGPLGIWLYHALALDRAVAAFKQPRVMGPVIFVINLSFNNVLTTCFNTFDCHPNVVAGRRYLTQDFGVECFTPTHFLFRVIAGVVMITFGLGLPIFFARLLKRNRHRLYEPSFFASFSFLYDGLSAERGQQGYDVKFAMTRKALVVLIGNLLKDSVLQLLAGAFLMLFALIALLVLQPYAQPMWNVLESASVATILITILATLAYVRAQTNVTICAGYSDRTIPPGADEDCGTSRTFLQKMDIGATALLLLVNLAALFAFAFIFFRMQSVQAIRARVRNAGSAVAAVSGAQGPPSMMQKLCCPKRAAAAAAAFAAKRPKAHAELTPDQVTDQVLLILEGTVRRPASSAGRRCACGGGGGRSSTVSAAAGAKTLSEGARQQREQQRGSVGCCGRLATRVVVGVEIPLHLACERAEELTLIIKQASDHADEHDDEHHHHHDDDGLGSGSDTHDGSLKRAGVTGMESASAARHAAAYAALRSGGGAASVSAAVAAASGGASSAGAKGGAAGADGTSTSGAGATAAGGDGEDTDAAAAKRNAALRFAASSVALKRVRTAGPALGGSGAVAGSSSGGFQSAGGRSLSGSGASRNGRSRAPPPVQQQLSLFAVAAARRRNLAGYNIGTGEDASDTVSSSLGEEARRRAELALRAVTAFKLVANAGSSSGRSGGGSGSGGAGLAVTPLSMLPRSAPSGGAAAATAVAAAAAAGSPVVGAASTGATGAASTAAAGTAAAGPASSPAVSEKRASIAATWRRALVAATAADDASGSAGGIGIGIGDGSEFDLPAKATPSLLAAAAPAESAEAARDYDRARRGSAPAPARARSSRVLGVGK